MKSTSALQVQFAIVIEMGDKEKHFLVLDVGSTSARAHVFNSNFEIIGSSRYEVYEMWSVNCVNCVEGLDLINSWMYNTNCPQSDTQIVL